DRQLVPLRVRAQEIGVLAVLGIGDHHLHAVVADLVGETERLFDAGGEDGGGGQAHGDPSPGVLVAARGTRRQPLGGLLAGRAMGAAASAVGLARTVARRIRGRTITAWAHGISSGWTGVVSMQQGAP